jgi:hypothetical protein
VSGEWGSPNFYFLLTTFAAERRPPPSLLRRSAAVSGEPNARRPRIATRTTPCPELSYAISARAPRNSDTRNSMSGKEMTLFLVRGTLHELCALCRGRDSGAHSA